MSDPMPIDVAKILAKISAFQASPDGKRHAAEYTASEERRRRDALLDVCDSRGVPEEPGLRAAVVSPQSIPALDVVRGSLGWRNAQRVSSRAKQPVAAILGGIPGTGKSTALAWAIAHHERSAAFVLARTIGSTSRNGYSTNTAAIERWSRVDLLAIDELGHEDNPDGSERISALIAERYDAGRATLCATNLDAEGFLARYINARLESRLHRGQFRGGAPGAWPYFHVIVGADLRGVENADGSLVESGTSRPRA